ncbi:MAG: ribonuclease regulator RraA [Devosia sp.]|nr:ribonuclease regulator RraA [Devosia sp.]
MAAVRHLHLTVKPLTFPLIRTVIMVDALAPMDNEVREKLLKVSTATLATSLFKRGLRSQFMQGVQRLTKSDIKLVGPAYTLRYIPAREDIDVIEVFRDTRHPQRLAVETIPAGHVLVMDCRGDASAASAGSILLTRMMIRGVAGVVTDGGIRDSDNISTFALPTYCAARSAPTNLTKHHAVDLNVPVGCGTVAVFPGDILVGDGDGVIVIPAEIAAEVAEQAVQQERIEEFLAAEIAAGKPLAGIYPPNADTLERYRRASEMGDAETGTAAI